MRDFVHDYLYLDETASHRTNIVLMLSLLTCVHPTDRFLKGSTDFSCPMCSKKVDNVEVTKVENVSAVLLTM